MKCKEVEKLIPQFMEDNLDTIDLREFLEHIDQCDECMEEVSIQFLIEEGLLRLEDGNVFDLQNELDRKLEEQRNRLKIREGLQQLQYSLEFMVFGAIVILIILLHIL